MHWQTSSGSLSLEEPVYLGILNLTPDSFSDGGAYPDSTAALAQARQLVARGADLLDLGGESTRLGARPVSPSEEWQRVGPVFGALRREFPSLPLSLDSRHGEVAAKAVGLGAAVLNDVTGFTEAGMLGLAREGTCGVIAMRSRTKDGQLLMPPYDDPTPRTAETALGELRELKARLLQAGIPAERILLDPGFGFGTTFREDCALWEALPRFAEALDWPVAKVCLGVSRKRFLAGRAGNPGLPPRQRDELTEAAHAEARSLGFRVFRTHALAEPAVRPARAEDAEAIAAVHVASWREAYRGMLPETFLDGLSRLGKEALAREAILHPEGPGHRLVVLDRGGRILGFAATGPGRDGAAELFAIYLHPSVWSRGLGRTLLAAAVADLARGGFTRVTLWVLERNARARTFYDALGWRPTGALRTQWQSGIIMRELEYGFSIAALNS